MNNLPIFELFIEDTDEIGLAVVDRPAIEKDFLYFNDETIKMTFDNDKFMIKGAALIPNKLIYRNDIMGERYVYFSEETIVKFVELLMSKDKNKFNLGHTNEVLNATIIESYFASEPNEYNVPRNSWIVSMKVNDLNVWQSIKDGKFKGFSIEGVFSSELNKFINNKSNMSELKERIMTALNTVLFSTEDVKFAEDVIVPEVEVPVVEDEPAEKSVDEKLAEMKLEILAEVDAKIAIIVESMASEFTKVDEKVEKFGALPLEESIKEVVAIPVIEKGNKAAQYFKK